MVYSYVRPADLNAQPDLCPMDRLGRGARSCLRYRATCTEMEEALIYVASLGEISSTCGYNRLPYNPGHIRYRQSLSMPCLQPTDPQMTTTAITLLI